MMGDKKIADMTVNDVASILYDVMIQIAFFYLVGKALIWLFHLVF